MRTSKLKIDLDSTCKELKFLHVSILQASTDLTNIWLQGFISKTLRDLPPAFPARYSHCARHPKAYMQY